MKTNYKLLMPFIELAKKALEESVTIYDPQINRKIGYTHSRLTKKQMRARKRAKNAKKSRRANRIKHR